MRKHTPKPWIVRATQCNTNPPGKLQMCVESPGHTVAYACGGDGFPDEANAHLISAAPDLLEALERLRDGVANWITRGVTDEDMEIAGRAIAKAKGETCEPTG